MDKNLFSLNPFVEENDLEASMIILRGKVNDFGSLLTNMIKNYNDLPKAMIANFPNDDFMMSKKVINSKEFNLLSSLADNDFETFDTRPTLRLGSSGPDVIELQRVLTKLLYYTGSINGDFDVTTENAVKSFQINNRLTADGVVGRDTWSALFYLYSPLAICEGEENYFLYTVVRGDTLWNLAQRFNTTVSAIKSLNGLTSDNLNIGQVLKIPRESSEPNYTSYTVVRGDTLWNLAQRFNTTVSAIKSLNGLTSDNLSIGQVLRIPRESSEPNYTLYTVVRGDTLWNLARRFNTTVSAIKSLNGLTSDNLSIGQVLRMPRASLN